MYSSPNISLIQLILDICILIAFFVAVIKIGKIYQILRFFRDIELRKPENWYSMKCAACGRELKVSKATYNHVTCTCGSVNKINIKLQLTEPEMNESSRN
jgi:hypothetical protein